MDAAHCFTVAHYDFEQSGQEIIAVFLGFGPPDDSKKFTLDYRYKELRLQEPTTAVTCG